MEKIVLNKDIKIEDNLVIINENVQTTMDRGQLEIQLRDINMRKARLQEQNVRIISEYNQLMEEENEINNLISQLAGNAGIQQI